MVYDESLWALLAFAAFAAGFIDAIGGGGGLVQVPALFGLISGVPPAALLGTNKMAAMVGTAGAGWHYARANPVDWRIVAPAAAAAFLLSFCGAWLVTQVPADALRKLIPFLLLAVLAYTLLNRSLGLESGALLRSERAKRRIATAGTGAVGFYDGVFGPGAGAFYKMVFVRGVGLDFLRAAAPSKIVNVASNLGALILFAASGHVLWLLGAWMMLFNLAGGQFGARVGITFGSALIRRVFILVVALLVLKTFHDAWLA
jgi:uncharacterized membrane protein YfcA